MTELDDTNIRHFKLSSGEEVVAVVAGKVTDKMITLEHAMRVHILLTETGYKFMFSVWQPMSKDDTCQLNPMHIISHVECANDIKERYVRMCIQQDQSDNTDDDNEFATDDEFDEHFDSILSKDGPTGSDPVH